MEWNLTDIAFLHPPDVFTGRFDNAKMQARHEEQMHKKLETIKTALAQANDPLVAFKILHKKDHLQFLQNNLELFREAGRLEEAVLALYGKLNAPFSSGGDAALWNKLFLSCDPEMLSNLGEPVPFTSATVFRGSVSGHSRSLSWTPARQRAEQFAERWKDSSLGGGALYEVDVTDKDVLIHRRLRHDQEVILSPDFIATAAIRAFTPAG